MMKEERICGKCGRAMEKFGEYWIHGSDEEFVKCIEGMSVLNEIPQFRTKVVKRENFNGIRSTDK